MHRIVFVFLDGVGLGRPGPQNPLSEHRGAGLARLSGGAPWTRSLEQHASTRRVVRSLDATLGIDGLPQSGTGQGSLFTGVNCARAVGRHFGPFPHSANYEVLDHDNLFHHVQEGTSTSAPVAFANAYPPQFFNASRHRWTVTTRCCAGADVALRGIDALEDDRAIAADLTGAAWRDLLDLDVSPRTEEEAAEALIALHRVHRLTLFEYFLTDKAGHKRGSHDAQTLLERLDRFFATLLDALRPATETLVVTSDHGNVETTAHTQHTRNPVPLFVHGWAAPHFADASTLTDVTPAIVNALQDAGEKS